MDSRTLPGIEEFVSGKPWEVHEIVLDSGRAPVSEFLETLEVHEHQAALALCVRLLAGPPFSPQGKFFKQLKGKDLKGLWQIRAADQLRILGFKWRSRLVLTNGWKKKEQQTDPNEIERCQRIRNQWVEVSGSK